MQVKVLYSFNNNGTVFLSRSKNQYLVKIARIPLPGLDELVTLGAFDLRSCAQQVLRSSSENFKLQTEDYAVYYKDITEQPDEPFVANGGLSALLGSSKQHLIPGRVCQNLSASFLFGDNSNVSSLTLEIRLKFHTIEKTESVSDQKSGDEDLVKTEEFKRPAESTYHSMKRQRNSKPSSVAAAKATRTKSLPLFHNPHNLQISNIINADKANFPSKYDSKSVQDRFKLAPFLQAKIIDKKSRNYRQNSVSTPGAGLETPLPQRAMRTRSMVTNQLMISSPINEEVLSDETDGTDDTEYQELTNNNTNEEPIDDEEDDDEYPNDTDSLPYTPQQPPYKPSSSNNQFHSLPDLEELDSKKIYTIPHNKLPRSHGLVCTNNNCATKASITWRYFETNPQSSENVTLELSKDFEKSNYQGMFGPLCNACYLFLRNKGFMRPEAVVKKYLQLQRYKKEFQKKEDVRLGDVANRKVGQLLSSLPMLAPQNTAAVYQVQIPTAHKFPTPSHTPSAINQVIQNNNNRHCNDLNDFMNQLNAFGGPLTDIDPLPLGLNGTPPMVATKSNTRVINLYDDGEDKENFPPVSVEDTKLDDFEKMMVRSFSLRASPDQSEWNAFFGEPTPKDQITPRLDEKPTPAPVDNGLPQLRTFKLSPYKLDGKKATVVNMPSSPLLQDNERFNLDAMDDLVQNDIFVTATTSSPGQATRSNTVMSYGQKQSSPNSDIHSYDEKR